MGSLGGEGTDWCPQKWVVVRLQVAPAHLSSFHASSLYPFLNLQGIKSFKSTFEVNHGRQRFIQPTVSVASRIVFVKKKKDDQECPSSSCPCKTHHVLGCTSVDQPQVHGLKLEPQSTVSCSKISPKRKEEDRILETAFSPVPLHTQSLK